MAITGVGIDLVDITRFESILRSGGRSFLRRVFTSQEIRYARTRRRPAEHLAARFAVKEAVMKALKTGWSHGISWTDIETVRASNGAVEVKITGEAEKFMRRRKIARVHISIAHSRTHAAAFAIAER